MKKCTAEVGACAGPLGPRVRRWSDTAGFGIVLTAISVVGCIESPSEQRTQEAAQAANSAETAQSDGSSGGLTDHDGLTSPGMLTAASSSSNAPVQGCYGLKNKDVGKYLSTRGDNNYRADTNSLDRGERFFLRKVDPHTESYVIYDENRRYVTRNGNSNIEAESHPTGDAQWELVDQGDGWWYIEKPDSNRRIKAASKKRDIEQVTDNGDKRKWRLEPTTGCKSPFDIEPDQATDSVVPTRSSTDPVYGFADTHNHMFANEAFNGDIICGEPYHRFGVKKALDDCSAEHGAGGIEDIIGNFQRGDLTGYNTEGYPAMSWPKWDSLTQQATYYKWLERAHKGGMRLMVMLAMSNRAACKISLGGDDSCNDMNAIDRQLADAHDLVAYIDMESGGVGEGWFQIARSPSEARDIIADGKLAVVLGIETAELFNCLVDECDPAHVDQQLNEYYDKDVRYVFPLHGFDNAYGGAALYNPIYLYGNYMRNDEYQTVVDCTDLGAPEGTYAPDGMDTSDFDVLAGLFGFPAPNLPSTTNGHCNPRGLTALGEHLIRGLMSRRMLIDVDHMGYQTLEDTLDLAEAHDYPVIGGHASFTELKSKPDEFDRTPWHAQRIAELGGLIAPIANQGNAKSGVYDCKGSSKSFVQSIDYITNTFGIAGVPVGTDANGMAKLPRPRYGSDSCSGQSTADRLAYPFSIPTASGTFGQMKTGNRSFSYNTEGFANVGLFPDFIADMLAAGFTEAEIDPFLHSAEAFIQMWERTEP